MMTRGLAFLALLMPLLSGCATRPLPVVAAPAPVVAPPPPARPEPVWRGIASASDQALVDGLTDALARARAAVPKRLAARLKEQDPLVDPGAGLVMPQLTPGSYYCRLIRFGGTARFQTFAPDFCYVDVVADGLSFTKQTGVNVHEGYLHPDTDRRLVFLGTSRTAGTKGGKAYGHDPAADQVGIVERVAPFRWRLILGHAGQGATLDVYELVPVPATVQDAKPATQPD